MRNQKEISGARFSRIRWKQRENGCFYGEQTIARKPFGEFTVAFQIDVKTAKTSVKIENEDFFELNYEKTCADYEEAVQSVIQRFNEIAELVGTLPKDAEEMAKREAREKYNKIIAMAVSVALIGKEIVKEK